MAETKNWMDFLIAVIPSVIATGGGLATAALVTFRLERQKQKMELYKVLYAERLTGAKRLLELANEAYFKVVEYESEPSEENRESLRTVVREMLNLTLLNTWVWSPQLIHEAHAFTETVGEMAAGEEDGLPGGTVEFMGDRIMRLNGHVSDMMQNDHLTQAVMAAPAEARRRAGRGR